MLYGEGEMAFIRLQGEIIQILDDYSIFAWKSDQSSHCGFLVSSPEAFQNYGDLALENGSFISGKKSLDNKQTRASILTFHISESDLED